MPIYVFERSEGGEKVVAERFYPLDEMPRYGERVEFDGHEWVRVVERGGGAVRMEPVTIAHSMPRRGDRRDPGAPRYDRRGRPVLKTAVEKMDYAKRYTDKNHEPMHFERTSSQGAFGDEE